MKEKIDKIKNEIADLGRQVSEKWKQIDTLYASCQHSWTEPAIRIKKLNYDCGAYGGSDDYREWERECKVCGKLETTRKETLVSLPDFENNNGKITIPHFNWNVAAQHQVK